MRFQKRYFKSLAVALLLTTMLLSLASSAADHPAEVASTAPVDVPENLTTDDPFDVALGGGYVFWTKLVGEFCSPPGSVNAVNLTTRVPSTLRSACDISPANVVADDAHIYYAEWQGDTIERLPVGGVGSSTVASASGLIFHRALALDDTHVYFGDDSGIKRVSKGGGAVDTLAASYDSAKLAVDDAYAYWTERSPGGGGAIRRVLKSGGAVQTILSGSSLDDPWAIAVDETHVYWTELGSGKARRMPKAGGSVSDFVPVQALYQGGDIAVNTTHVYWTDTTSGADGRLRRAPKGGGTVEDLALGLFGPGGVNLSNTHVYWGDNGGVWRLPLDAGTVAVDLTVSAMEITQGIQNLANDVPLVGDKTAYVRVYPEVDIADTPNVGAVLHGTRGGIALPGSPLSPMVPTVYVRQAGGNRDFLSNSFNFWVPPAWRSGTVTFRAEINPDASIPETDADNNSFSVTRTFNAKDPICVDMVRVRTNPTTASVYDAGFWDVVDWMKASYPVPDVWIYRGGTIEELEVCWWGPFPYPCGGPYEMPDDSSWVLTKLWTYNLFTNDPSECGDQAYYHGMVHQSHLSQGGAGYRPGDESWGAFNTDPSYLGGAWPWYVPHGGSTLAHEVGHNLGRRHVDCGGPANPDGGYPYNGCDIGPDDPTAYYGFDVLDVAVIPPTTAGDLMSYAMSVGKPRWPSDYNYRALYNQLPGAMARVSATPSALARQVVQAEEVLAVTGVITPSEGTATLNYGYRLPQGQVASQKLNRLASRILAGPLATYSLRLLDESEQVLAEQAFDLPDEGNPVGETRSFNMLMPYDPATAAIVLAEDSTELARQTVSPSPPSVEVLSPNGGENISGTMTIEWDASDPDGDTPLFTVQYSPNGGADWQTLATDYYTQTLVLGDLSTIPGSNNALIQVMASDGVNTASDTSDGPFQVATQPPDAHISQPTNEAVFTTDVQIILNGNGLDAEDGPLGDSALQWFVDGASVGAGKELALSSLSAGRHVITLKAVDSDDDKGTHSVQILVGDERVFLPLIQRNP
jgi:hypothetical protein